MNERNGAGVWDVLVVDDEAVVREGIELVLSAEGLRVATAPDGKSALAHAALGSCRLVLCDLMLPDCPGVEVLSALRKSRPELPVVIITGLSTSENVARAQESGASDFLNKPFEESELLDVVWRALGGRDHQGKEKER